MAKPEITDPLRIYRPGTEDAADPEIAHALKAAERDADLGTLLEKNTAFHATVRRALRSTAPPAGMREAILQRARRRTLLVRFGWHNPWVWAAAAGMVLLLTAPAFWARAPRPEADTFASFRVRMAKAALREYRMDLITNDATQVRSFLRQQGAPGDYDLPAKIEATRLFGCAALRWHDRPVSMLCFKRRGDELLWVFVIQRANLADPPTAAPGDGPAADVSAVGKLITASWTSGDKTYLVGTLGDDALIREYL